MSISYVDDISDGQGICIFAKILGRWKGSLYKLVWIDLLLYITAYYVLNLSYRFAMNESQKKVFEEIVYFCEKTKGDIPISFLLGFFVAGIIGRWYRMYMYIPWMNEVALHVSTAINGHDEIGARKIRLTIMRYLNLSWILMMRLISDQIATRFSPPAEDANADGHEADGFSGTEIRRRRQVQSRQKICRNTCHPWSIDATETFKTTTPIKSFLPHPVKLGTPSPSDPVTPNTPFLAPLATTDSAFASSDAFLAEDDRKLQNSLMCFNRDPLVKRTFGIIITESEVAAFQHTALECYKRTKTKYTPEYWVPIQWAQRLVLKALQSGYIVDPKIAYYLLDQLGDVRKQMQDLQIFSSIMIPLVYTQVVIIAVYSYFMCQIFACQFVENRPDGDLKRIDLYVPIFSIFSFLFLMGWLKVALCVMNPFGDDDEDFQTSSILDYNLEVSFRSVYMDDNSFPQHMSFPLGTKRSEAKPDDLEAFLADIDCDLNQMMSNPVDNNTHNSDINPSRLSRCRKWFCCESSEPNVPNIPVTNADNPLPKQTSSQHPSVQKWNWM